MRIFLLLLFAAVFVSLKAQDISSRYPLSEALNYYESVSGVSFSYDAEAIDLLRVDFDYRLKTIEEALEVIKKETPISFEQISESYYSLAFTEQEFKINLVDSSDQQPLVGSYVNILVNDEIIAGGNGLDDGTFLFRCKPDVRDRLSVYVLGYNSFDLPLAHLLDNRELVVSVSPKTTYLDDLVIQDYLTTGISLDPVSQSIKIGIEDLPSLPGETDGDIFASLALLPGVSTPDNRPGNLFIRGSSTDQSLILFDNIPIYHRGHYFGTISPYNPKLVESVNVHRSGLHSRLGGRVGGAVEINSSSNLSDESKYGFGLNSLYGIGYVKTPIFNKKVGFAIGGRRSFPVSFSSPKLDAISDVIYAATAVSTQQTTDFNVVYEDYNAKLEFPINERVSLSVSSIYAGNSLGFSVIKEDTISNKQRNGFENLGLNASLKSIIGEKIKSNTSFTFSNYHTFFKEGLRGQRGSIADLRDLRFNQEVEFGSRKSLLYQAGIGVDYQVTDYLFRGQQAGVRNQPPMIVSYGNETSSLSLSPYASVLFNKIEKLSVELGIRSTYYSRLDDLAFLPRVNASFDLSDFLILRGSYGRYRQYLSQIKHLEFSGAGFDNELWQLADGNVKIIKGHQETFGLVAFKGKMLLDIEIYRKSADNVTYSVDKRPESGILYDYANHTTQGIDVFLKSELGKSVDLWVGYSYSQLYLTFDSASNQDYKSQYDQPHIFYLGGSYSRGNFSLSANWKLSSGQYAYSVDVVKSENTFVSGALRQPRPGEPTPPARENPFDEYPRRLRNIHTLDISASYKLLKTENRPFLTSFGLSILNAYNQTNQTDQVVRAAVDVPVSFIERNAMKFAPNLMVTVEW
ncbi:MAG: TonB-dependent receptor plug domain-containing protein [Cyclobacteriaceae bacterium]